MNHFNIFYLFDTKMKLNLWISILIFKNKNGKLTPKYSKYLSITER